MKQIKLYFSFLLVLPLLLTNCNNDDNSSNPLVGQIVPPTAQKFETLKQNSLEGLTQTFNLIIDDTGSITFTSQEGVSISLYTSCLTIGGVVVEGDIKVEFIELYNKANLLTTNIATMGKHSNGDLEMLVTGGAFYINVTKDGQAVDSNCGFSMQIPTSLTGGVDYDMILWYGDFDDQGNLVWEEANGEQGQGGEMGIENDAYYVWANQFGWTNVDRFYNDPRPKTTILVDVPDGYNSSNSSVYLSYNGELGLARLDTYDEDTGYFSEHYGLIPVGLGCHLIFVSEYEEEWVYAIKSITINENDIIEIFLSDLDTATESELTALINALP